MVGQQRKHDLVPLGEVLQDRRIVIADRGQLDPLLLKSWFRILQLDQLRFAEGSPIRGPKEKKNCSVRST